MPIIGAGEADTSRNYSSAVERDQQSAHPIQAAVWVLPQGVFAIAGELYRYSVCAYDGNGRPLNRMERVDRAEWIIYDNVYMRRNGGAFPQNADRIRGAAAGMKREKGPRTPAVGADLWRRVIEHWGPPRGFAAPSE